MAVWCSCEKERQETSSQTLCLRAGDETVTAVEDRWQKLSAALHLSHATCGLTLEQFDQLQVLLKANQDVIAWGIGLYRCG